ncbi:unnamed protein product [Hanseniaspora opuntiae]
MLFEKYNYPEWDEMPYFDLNKDNKVAIVLHGDKKCGYHITKHLFKHGVKVYAYENADNAHSPIVDEISKKFGQIKYLCMDVTDLESVFNSCLYFKEKEDHLDLFIDSGGGYIASSHFNTNDDYEIQLQTNYIAQVLIIFQMIDLLDKCSGSIVSVSSFLHFLTTRTPLTEEEWSDTLAKYNRWPNFVPNVDYYNINVGILMDPSIYTHLTRLPIIGLWFWSFFQLVNIALGVDEEKSSKSVLQVALSSMKKKEESVTNLSNTDLAKYYNRGGKLSKSSRVSRDLDYSTATWINTVHSLKDRGYTSSSKL